MQWKEVSEAYCWGLKWAVRRSCCDRSRSWMLDFNWTTSYVHIELILYIVNCDLRKMQFATDHLAVNYCVRPM